MRTVALAADIREAERRSGPLLTDGVLMQRAATTLAAVAADLLGSVYGSRVVLLVGSGGNGGDALFAGARLARRGARVDAILLGDSAHEQGLTDLRSTRARVVRADDPAAVDAVGAADLVVDGIAGIGASAGLRPAAIALLDEVGPDTQVLAVDLPSGLVADTGAVTGEAVVADVTLTFGADKLALHVDPAAGFAGQVLLAGVGLAEHLSSTAAAEVLEADDVAALLRRPLPTDDKYARGVVGVLAGSDRYGGAGVLAVAGALGAGPGMVRFAGEPGVADAVRAAHPEVIVTDLLDASAVSSVGRVQAWVAGPGGGTDDRAAAVLAAVLASDLPVVVDADGLTLLAADPDLARLVVDRDATTVLTPHAGELARLLGVGRDEVEARRVEHAREAAEHFAATVLLKGSTTIVATPDRGDDGRSPGTGVGTHGGRVPLRVNPRATPWLATAGAGDVLAGAIGTLLAAGLDGLDAASVGAWLHAAAAELASQGGPIRAGEVAGALADVVASLLEPQPAQDSTP